MTARDSSLVERALGAAQFLENSAKAAQQLEPLVVTLTSFLRKSRRSTQ